MVDETKEWTREEAEKFWNEYRRICQEIPDSYMSVLCDNGTVVGPPAQPPQGAESAATSVSPSRSTP